MDEINISMSTSREFMFLLNFPAGQFEEARHGTMQAVQLIREQHLDKLSGVKAETSITAEPEAENDATFTPRDGWETNLQAAREYANHLRKAGKISEQDALKAWNSTESLAKLIKQIEVVQTPVVGHGDDAITLDQLKQLRIDTANKINQQEAGNRIVDDRLLRKKDQLDKAIAEAEGTTEKQAAPKEQFADNKLFTADRVAAARAPTTACSLHASARQPQCSSARRTTAIWSALSTARSSRCRSARSQAS